MEDRLRPIDWKTVGITKYNNPGLQTPKQASEFCKKQLKNMHKSSVIPFSLLLMQFVQIQQSDFNLTLLTFLAEEFHRELKHL